MLHMSIRDHGDEEEIRASVCFVLLFLAVLVAVGAGMEVMKGARKNVLFFLGTNGFHCRSVEEKILEDLLRFRDPRGSLEVVIFHQLPAKTSLTYVVPRAYKQQEMTCCFLKSPKNVSKLIFASFLLFVSFIHGSSAIQASFRNYDCMYS